MMRELGKRSLKDRVLAGLFSNAEVRCKDLVVCAMTLCHVVMAFAGGFSEAPLRTRCSTAIFGEAPLHWLAWRSLDLGDSAWIQQGHGSTTMNDDVVCNR
jgi:hypothetical protein